VQLQLRRLGLGNPSNSKDTFESIVENVMRIWKVYKVSWRIKWDRVSRAGARFDVAGISEILPAIKIVSSKLIYVIEGAETSCN
jgi:hypothetical protein